jgi:hypothetical protein
MGNSFGPNGLSIGSSRHALAGEDMATEDRFKRTAIRFESREANDGDARPEHVARRWLLTLDKPQPHERRRDVDATVRGVGSSSKSCTDTRLQLKAEHIKRD